MCVITVAITNEIARLEKRREKINGVLEASPEVRLMEIRHTIFRILQGDNTGPDDVEKKIKTLGEEGRQLSELQRFKYRNAKKYIRELNEIDRDLSELKCSSFYSKYLLSHASN
ncbi:MAG: hypothetical protein U5M23_13035 [Marinagarivorans sp.]|nr:hypothetical protein [Marinagarivorans sp.]